MCSSHVLSLTRMCRLWRVHSFHIFHFPLQTCIPPQQHSLIFHPSIHFNSLLPISSTFSNSSCFFHLNYSHLDRKCSKSFISPLLHNTHLSPLHISHRFLSSHRHEGYHGVAIRTATNSQWIQECPHRILQRSNGFFHEKNQSAMARFSASACL